MSRITTIASLALSLTISFFAVGVAQAKTYTLKAAVTTITLPDGSSVPAWGFADVSPGSTDTSVKVPGPKLEVAASDTLTIAVQNTLPVPVSINIPGLPFSSAPVPSLSGGRVMTFNRQIPAGTVATPGTGSVTFSTLKPGTYLYESGTNPAVQVPMGLYGALVINPAAAGQAYDSPSSAYDSQAVLLFSEIDPDLNTAVAAAPTTPLSTVDSRVRYFLVNGKAFPATDDISIPPGVTARKALFRFINAGSRNITPTLGKNLTVLAEDGKPYKYSKSLLTLILPAGKTMDALLDIPAGAQPFYLGLYDRRLGLMNGQSYTGGNVAGGAMVFMAGWDPLQMDCSPFKGDMNGDAKVTVADALAVLKLVAASAYDAKGDLTPLNNGLPCGNKGKTSLTIDDALMVLQKAVGMNPY